MAGIVAAASAAAAAATTGSGVVMPPAGIPGDETSDELRIEMLGAGQEVGRSCCVLRYKGGLAKTLREREEEREHKHEPSADGIPPFASGLSGKTVVCDSGVHPAYQGIAALPFIDELDWSTVDALLITHFHLDHAAALTYVMQKVRNNEWGPGALPNDERANAESLLHRPTSATGGDEST